MDSERYKNSTRHNREDTQENKINRISLGQLLKDDPRASYYFDALHPVVQHYLRQQGDKISTVDDLYAFANNAMTQALYGIESVYDDSDSFPD